MKSLGIFFVKFLLLIGAGWLLWHGVQQAQTYGSRGAELSLPSIEEVSTIHRVERERTAEERIVPQGTETIDAVAQETQPSTSPKDEAISVVTLGWGYRVTETQ